MGARSTQRVDFLDFMRIFAFSSVLVSHIFEHEIRNLSNDADIHLTLRILAKLIYDATYVGGAGVIVFFITSGYIITHVLQKETALEFGIKRLFRIYPLYIFAILLEATILYVDGNDFPPLNILLPRLLLLGDLFHTPYALRGVEWTLRVEVMFYVFMGGLKLARVLRMPKLLPGVFLGVVMALYFWHPFPRFAGWTDGYLLMFGSFLFIGSMLYLHEQKAIGSVTFFTTTVFIFVTTLVYTADIKPALANSNFALIGLSAFWVSWIFRDKFKSNVLTRTLSGMTYSIYLLHLWLWPYLLRGVNHVGLPHVPASAQVAILLFVICLVLSKTVEAYGIKLGRLIFSKTRKPLPDGAGPTPPGETPDKAATIRL